MNTKFYKEFQDKYPTILGSDRNISYTQFLEEMVTELQQINKNDLSGDVSRSLLNKGQVRHTVTPEDFEYARSRIKIGGNDG